jgi:hypothetical protein
MKGINLFKNVLLQDFKNDKIEEEFENHVLDLSYQIEQGNLDNLRDILKE